MSEHPLEAKIERLSRVHAALGEAREVLAYLNERKATPEQVKEYSGNGLMYLKGAMDAVEDIKNQLEILAKKPN